MTEYSLGFAREMADASKSLSSYKTGKEDADRAIIYMALVACEIALKAALENAGMALSDIRSRGHNLSALLEQVSLCSVQVSIGGGSFTHAPASRLRSLIVTDKYSDATVGKLLSAEDLGASKFPNEIRYGDTLRHFPSSVLADLACKVVEWSLVHTNILSENQAI